jgi:aspartyl-tRNA synthetase
MFRTHTCGELTAKNIGKKITLCGWVHSRRDHGGIIFIDLRDRYGLTQIVFDPKCSSQAHAMAESVRTEWVLQIQGKVRDRGHGLHNPSLKTGEIEIEITEVVVLNKSKTPPFEIDKEIKNEDLRMEYRYLDLRRDQMQKNLKLRHEMLLVIRNYFDSQNFLDVETPIMIKGTPEGSREYVVPSRLHPGKFYVLPQSPQQLKQLLMVGGIDRYYQIARCFRDEDLRGDRQPEFTQLDLEMSFVDQEDVMNVVEGCFHELTKQCVPEKKWKDYLKKGKFQRMTWHEAMQQYGTDKPDIRFALKLVNVTDISRKCGFGVFENAEYVTTLILPKNIGELSRKDIDEATDIAKQHGALGLAWYRVGEASGPVAKNAHPEFLDALKETTNAQDGDVIFFGAGEFIQAVEPLGAVRNAFGKKFHLTDENEFAYLWVYEFPLFEKKDDGTVQSVHHPFTSPHLEDVQYLKSDPMKVRSYGYDIVLNGVELGGGSVRIHDPKLQHTMFEILGLNEAETQRRFGHILKAFQYGCPPHGGCAMGIDRMIMMFADEPNIREVIAFPKNQSAQDLMLGAPSVMPTEELHEQNIQVSE